jgi:hypothetical protein
MVATRRDVLRWSVVTPIAVRSFLDQAFVSVPDDVAHIGPVAVVRRRAWAGTLPPTGALEQERPEDVRLLLVHHSASPNTYAESDVPSIIRGFYELHTGPTKRWPDVAYGFLVDRYGRIWEGRSGSIDGPVKGNATGGSQGFALLCCFIGDHSTEPPTKQAQNAMVQLLAVLAERHAIDTRPGAHTSFTSRGSNRWPAGAVVATSTIAGHRDMSATACPGDAAYALVRGAFPAAVSAARARWAATTAAPADETAPTASRNRGPTQSPTPTSATVHAKAPLHPGHRTERKNITAPLALSSGTAMIAAAALLLRLRRPAPLSTSPVAAAGASAPERGQ